MNLPEKAMEGANPFILKYFQDPNLFPALPEEIRNSEERLTEIVQNTSRFSDLIYKERKKRWAEDLTGLLGEEVHIPETKHADGRTRRAESGYRVNVDYLRSIGIDPSKVLFFRLTQPSDDPKPEYYWTSDYFEVLRDLSAEIFGEQRESAVILVSDLETVNENEGLIQDINDDQGLAVRQIGTGPFDQKSAIARFKPDQDLYDEPDITLTF
ncbi:hypothetical protein KY310_00665 [Candidatus Woesearchaeota archaeon]|nr:hypothetical protein [Candidatus Woesearchaeota archaeon]